MKHKLLAVIILIVVAAAFVGGAALLAPYVQKDELPPDNTLTLTVMTYNIRTIALSTTPDSPDYWETRKEALVSHILQNEPDIMGTQEVMAGIQDTYLTENLPAYSAVGIARDGANVILMSEKNMIFYKTDKFELLDSGTFWLSETPNKTSLGWDGDCRRICTYALLKDKKTGKIIQFFNTHFDHKGSEARQKGSAMVVDAVSKSEYPAILTGDFNFDETNVNYESMTLVLDDTKYLADTTMSYGSFHGYKGADLTDKSPIDFCMVTPNDFKVQSYEVLHGKHFGAYTSDHYAVKVRLSLSD